MYILTSNNDNRDVNTKVIQYLFYALNIIHGIMSNLAESATGDQTSHFEKFHLERKKKTNIYAFKVIRF